MLYASRAIITSSSVGITATFTLLFSVEIRASLPLNVALSSLLISTPNASAIKLQTDSRVAGEFSPIPAEKMIKSAPPNLTKY